MGDNLGFLVEYLGTFGKKPLERESAWPHSTPRHAPIARLQKSPTQLQDRTLRTHSETTAQVFGFGDGWWRWLVMGWFVRLPFSRPKVWGAERPVAQSGRLLVRGGMATSLPL